MKTSGIRVVSMKQQDTWWWAKWWWRKTETQLAQSFFYTPNRSVVIAHKCQTDRWPKKLFTTTHEMNVNHEESIYIWQYLKVKKLYCLKLTPKSLPHAVNVQVTTHACLLPSVSSHIFFKYPTPKHFLTYYTKIKTVSMWYTQARPLKY